MKKIDLLNKMANDELPDKTRVIFKEHNTECIYHKDGKKFEFVNKGDWDNYFYGFDFKELDEEVEIIEDKPKKIEKLSYQQIGSWHLEQHDYIEYSRAVDKQIKQLGSKLNELIGNLNYLLEKDKNNE